jgi:hypothetical protein
MKAPAILGADLPEVVREYDAGRGAAPQEVHRDLLVQRT